MGCNKSQHMESDRKHWHRLEAPYIYDTVCDALIDGVKEQLVVDVLLVID